MRHSQSYKVIRRRRIVRGGGIKDDIIEFGRNGVRYLKMKTIDGVKRLVPIAVRSASNAAANVIDSLSNKLQSVRVNPKVAQAAKDGADSLFHSIGERLGGAVRPGRHLLLKEINYAMSRSGGRKL